MERAERNAEQEKKRRELVEADLDRAKATITEKEVELVNLTVIKSEMSDEMEETKQRWEQAIQDATEEALLEQNKTMVTLRESGAEMVSLTTKAFRDVKAMEETKKKAEQKYQDCLKRAEQAETEAFQTALTNQDLTEKNEKMESEILAAQTMRQNDTDEKKRMAEEIDQLKRELEAAQDSRRLAEEALTQGMEDPSLAAGVTKQMIETLTSDKEDLQKALDTEKEKARRRGEFLDEQRKLATTRRDEAVEAEIAAKREAQKLEEYIQTVETKLGEAGEQIKQADEAAKVKENQIQRLKANASKTQLDKQQKAIVDHAKKEVKEAKQEAEREKKTLKDRLNEMGLQLAEVEKRKTNVEAELKQEQEDNAGLEQEKRDLQVKIGHLERQLIEEQKGKGTRVTRSTAQPGTSTATIRPLTDSDMEMPDAADLSDDDYEPDKEEGEDTEEYGEDQEEEEKGSQPPALKRRRIEKGDRMAAGALGALPTGWDKGKDGKYHCPVKSCKRRGDSPEDIRLHLLNVHWDVQHCRDCLVVLTDDRLARDHWRLHDAPEDEGPSAENPPFRCPGCNKGFDSFEACIEHVKKRHTGKGRKFPCRAAFCRKTFSRLADSDGRHYKDVHGQKFKYTCLKEGCTYTSEYGTSRALKDHHRDQHRGEEWEYKKEKLEGGDVPVTPPPEKRRK